jgi:hypothetical protein
MLRPVVFCEAHLLESPQERVSRRQEARIEAFHVSVRCQPLHKRYAEGWRPDRTLKALAQCEKHNMETQPESRV